ncbi:MAG: MerR HTH family regulatory protein [Bacteriophage sp.]|nr:MAG: MerR HTH family regulatory protein [Bacteriophage sp.]UWI02348.1 MAG: MerR HTH family regulatory protein [Bacteriophage sp.]
MAIKEIMKETDIKSEQTIYRILDSNGVPRRPKVRGVRKIFVTIEEDVAAILDKEQSVSLYVNEAIRFYHGNRH